LGLCYWIWGSEVIQESIGLWGESDS
jgi:hypothetical protein